MKRNLLYTGLITASLVLTGCKIEPRNQSTVTVDQTLTAPNTPQGTNGLSCSFEDQKTALVNIMTGTTSAQGEFSNEGLYYLTANNVDPAPFTSLNELVIAMRDPRDHWSYVKTGNNNPTSQLQSAKGYNSQFGFRWSLHGGSIRINYVFPNSPASNSGLTRGATITSVNSTPVNSLAGFAKALADNSVTLGLSNGSNIVVSRNNFTSPDITNVNTYTLSNGSKVGYFYLDNFDSIIEDELSTTFAQFKADNIQSLIIDLRYNGGGLIYSAYQLAHMIVGNTKHGLIFDSFSFNPQHTSKNDDLLFDLSQFSSSLQQNALSLNKVVFLTSDGSASSSELLIKGLQPHIDVSIIGTQTHGKPYGMKGVDICGNEVWPVSFLNLNSNLQTTPLSGIAPTCAVSDDLNAPLGSTSEAMLNKAISYLDSGSC